MTQRKLKILEKAIHANDISTFRAALETSDTSHQVVYQECELLIKALRLGRKRIVNLLLDKGCRVTKPGRGITPLHIAASKIGWSSVVHKLIARGARVDVRNDNGATPIHVAFLNGAAGFVIDHLLKCYTRHTLLDIVDKDGLGLLHIACTRPNLDIVEAFVDVGGSNVFSQVSPQTNSPYAGYTPLHFAVANGRHTIARALCRYEANVGVVNRNGSTPIHLAVERRDVKMIDMLLRCADWNVNYVDSSGVSHFMAACAGSDPEIVKQFLRIATDTSPNTQLINVISARVKDSDDCPFAGYTPMHFAAEFDRLGTMQLLIARGAHLTMTTCKLSPLDLARKRCHESISALLARHCRECIMCQNFVPESEKNTVFVGVDNSNQTFQLDSILAENQETSIDECCLLDIFPLPEHKTGINVKDDCELCKLQDIFSIDNCKNQYCKDNFIETETRTITKVSNVICNFRLNCTFCKYVSNRQIFILFMTAVACIYIVACIVFILKSKLT